jgi:GntR family transcriptional regulator
LVDQVRSAVGAGRLRGGDKLPSVRDVVAQVTINPNTVHRAYRELEHLGLAEGRLGLGTFITEQASGLVAATGQEDLGRGLREWVSKAAVAGLTDDDMLALLRQILNRSDQVVS